MQFILQTDSTSLLPHIKQHTLSFLLYDPKGAMELLPAVTAKRAKDVAGQAFIMYPHQHRFIMQRGRAISALTANAQTKGEVEVVVNKGTVKVKRKVPIGRGQFYGNPLFNQSFLFVPIFNNICNGTDFEMMLFSELSELREFCHIPVFCHNLTDNRSGFESCNACQVYGTFCVSCPDQHPASLRL